MVFNFVLLLQMFDRNVFISEFFVALETFEIHFDWIFFPPVYFLFCSATVRLKCHSVQIHTNTSTHSSAMRTICVTALNADERIHNLVWTSHMSKSSTSRIRFLRCVHQWDIGTDDRQLFRNVSWWFPLESALRDSWSFFNLYWKLK